MEPERDDDDEEHAEGQAATIGEHLKESIRPRDLDVVGRLAEEARTELGREPRIAEVSVRLLRFMLGNAPEHEWAWAASPIYRLLDSLEEVHPELLADTVVALTNLVAVLANLECSEELDYLPEDIERLVQRASRLKDND